MLVIRLQPTGRKNSPAYRIVVAEKARPVQGKFHEVLGHYLPTRDPAEIEFKQDRIEFWIGNGAVPSETVARLLKKNGIDGLDKFIGSYTKKKKRNPSEEEIAAEEAKNNPPAPEPEVAEEAPAEEKIEEAPKEEEKAEEAPVEEKAEEAPKEDEKKEEAPAEEVASDETDENGDTDKK